MITSNCMVPPNNSANRVLDVVSVDKGVGVAFQFVTSIESLLAGAAVPALCRLKNFLVSLLSTPVFENQIGTADPCVFHSLEPDVAVFGRERRQQLSAAHWRTWSSRRCVAPACS